MTRERDAAQAITAALWRAMLDRGPGTIKRTEKTMGVVPDTLRGARNSTGLRLWHVTEAIKALGIPSSVFFDDAIGGVSSTAAERFMARGAELAARKLVDLPELADDIKLDRLTEDDLARLDAARFEDPRAAAEQATGVARQAARDGRRGDAAAAVARQGSALRVAEMWEPAWVCVWWALKNAPESLVRANAWLRGALIVADFGKFDDAAELSHLALIKHAELGEVEGIGPVLSDRGMFLRRAGKLEEALASLKAALRALPESSKANRLATYQNLAMVYLGRNDVHHSEACIEKADAIDGIPAMFRVRSRWIRARIAANQLKHSRAIEHFRAVLPDLEIAPGDATLASAELCRELLNAGRATEAIATARGMAPLAISRSQNDVVAAAILDLYRSAQEGALTLALTERTIRQIRLGLRQRVPRELAAE